MVGQTMNDVKVSTILRIGTFILGLALIGLGVKKFALLAFVDPLDFILAVYYIIFGVLVCISELPFKSLLRCCSFLGFFWGKALFLCFLATISFDYTDIYSLIVSIALYIAAGAYGFLALTCQKNLSNKDEEEGGEKKKGEEGEKKNFKPVDQSSSKADSQFPKPPELPALNRI